ncbi:MAG: VWA domain-containing protein [Actinomycetaceae bacterium]|nr:VWA domain-containing protein [Actinomycetaceae bacterium]
MTSFAKTVRTSIRARQRKTPYALLMTLMALSLCVLLSTAPVSQAVADDKKDDNSSSHSSTKDVAKAAAQGSLSRTDYLTPVVVVFDTSGSMTEEDQHGVVKLSAAKNIMDEVLSGGSIKSALWTYPGGTTDSEGCQPGTWVPGSSWTDDADSTKVNADIRLLQASGDTPTGPALRAVASQLGADEEAEIFLVSDGKSNCGESPCDVAKELIAQGYKITVQPIGFDLSDEDAQSNELKCIADATGGTYRTAQDAQELKQYFEDFHSSPFEFEVRAPKTVREGGAVSIDVTVHNKLKDRSLPGVRVRLGITDPDQVIVKNIHSLESHLPALLPDEKQTLRWVLSLKESTGVVDWSVSVGAQGVGAEIEQGSFEVVNSALDYSEAGSLLKDINGDVVIMGDSYTSGEGTGDYLTEEPVGCHRSGTSTYAKFLYNSNHNVQNIACSGAQTSHIEQPQFNILRSSLHKGSQEPQILQLQWIDNVGAVFLTLGGNDVNFGDLVKACVTPGQTCAIEYDKNKNLKKGPTVNSYALMNNLYHRQNKEAKRAAKKTSVVEPGTFGRLPRIYKRINDEINSPDRVKKRGGYAPIIVSAYPFPLEKLRGKDCNTFIDRVEVDTMRYFVQSLNQKISNAVDAARDTWDVPIFFVHDIEDMAQPGHTMCGKKEDSYFVVLDDAKVISVGIGELSGKGNPLQKQELVHPNIKGNKRWAEELISWSQNKELPKDLRPTVPKKKLQQAASQPFLPFTKKVNISFDPSRDQSKQGTTGVANGVIDLSISSLKKKSSVGVTLHSDPIFLGNTAADKNGEAHLTIQIPPNTPAGMHSLEFTGTTKDGKQATMTVPIRVLSPLPLWLWMVGLATVAAAIAMVVMFIKAKRNLNAAKKLQATSANAASTEPIPATSQTSDNMDVP